MATGGQLKQIVVTVKHISDHDVFFNNHQIQIRFHTPGSPNPTDVKMDIHHLPQSFLLNLPTNIIDHFKMDFFISDRANETVLFESEDSLYVSKQDMNQRFKLVNITGT